MSDKIGNNINKRNSNHTKGRLLSFAKEWRMEAHWKRKITEEPEKPAATQRPLHSTPNSLQ